MNLSYCEQNGSKEKVGNRSNECPKKNQNLSSRKGDQGGKNHLLNLRKFSTKNNKYGIFLSKYWAHKDVGANSLPSPCRVR